jgi:CO/xanthine dehydrogenase Mo-binding subunit
MAQNSVEPARSQPGTWTPPEGTISPRSHLAKTTGEMRYTSDLTLPGMLIGGVLRSPHPHCAINHIDVRPALAIPGVHAALTAADIPGENSVGKSVADQEFLVSTRARTVLDAVAIVAAETKEAVRAALDAIELDLTPLPAVFDPEEALRPGAPALYPGGNLLREFHIRYGDATAAMAEADLVIEGTYTYPWIEHAFLETEAVLAAPSDDGTITIWYGCHDIYGERQVLAKAFGWPEERFRVILVPAGGSFGGKDDNLMPVWVSLLASRTGRPVRIVFDRAESIRGHSKRHSQRIHHQIGLRADGTLVAAEVDLLMDTGAYVHWGEGIMRFASLQSTGPYRVPNAHVRARLVYTNNLVAGAMRCWGTPGVEFAMETQMDRAARALGIHPLKLRWMNALRDGDETITGRPIPHGARVRETLEAAARHAGVTLATNGKEAQ